MRTELRLYGDPFDGSRTAALLCATLAEARARGFGVGLCLTAVARGATGSPGAVRLTNGVQEIGVTTDLGEPELSRVLIAARTPVSAGAPIAVFGNDALCVQAGLEYRLASFVMRAEAEPRTTLARIEAFLQSAEESREGAREIELAPFLALEGLRDTITFAHPGSDDPRFGTDVVVRAFAALPKSSRAELLIVLPQRNEELELGWRAIAPGRVTFHAGRFTADLLRDVAGIVLPFRRLIEPETLVEALASGRPVLASRAALSAAILSAPGICQPIGGRYVSVAGVQEPEFEPSVRALAHAIRKVLEEPVHARAIGVRARDHVLTSLLRGAPVPPVPPPRGDRPLVVLEAPLFERSSTSVLTIATAKALLARGNVDLRLVPAVPFVHGYEAFANEHPDLAPLCTARLPRADLWLASGWPPRVTRPNARTFALRIDWEYGALPTELMPLVSDEADSVVVHSRHVLRGVAACGRAPDTIDLVPHGVSAELFAEQGPELDEIVSFKRGRKALLFAGGLIWRKGPDLLLKVLAEHWQREDPVCLIVKSNGGETSYAGFDLTEIVRRFAGQTGAVETLLIERDLGTHEMAALYRACDLLVHPYRGEGFAMPVLEARACGLPVLVTEGGSTDDFCEGAACVRVAARKRAVELPFPTEGPAWVLEPDPEALRARLAETLKSLDALRAQARAEAPRVRARWSWDAAAAAIERLACLAPCREPVLA